MKKRLFQALFIALLLNSCLLMASERFSLSGRIDTSRSSDIDKMLDTLAALGNLSSQEYKQALIDGYTNSVRIDYDEVTVTLKKDDKIYVSKLDDKGFFKFTDLPVGEYRIIAEAPSWSMKKGQSTAMLSVSTLINEQTRSPLILKLNSEFAILKGRLVDPAGKPIANGKVVVTGRPPSTNREAPNWSGRSGADGEFEIHGIEAAPWFRVYNYLINKNSHLGGATAKIEVTADGYTTAAKYRDLQVPLATENGIAWARRMLAAHNEKNLQKTITEVPEREFPLSRGEVILLGDIVLEKR